LCLMAAIVATQPLGATEAPCPLTGGGDAVVESILDSGTIVLQDGTPIRLAATIVPHPSSADGPAEAEFAGAVQHWLEESVKERRIRYAFDGRRDDRRGRKLAHVFVDGGVGWLQSALVERGFARVDVPADNAGCVAPLLAREQAARRSRRGLWATPIGEILPAEPPERALREAGRFAIVEGKVLTVGERRLRTYLNFGTYWNVDFTVIVAGRDRDRFAEPDLTLGSLEGRTVRVRGWVLDDRGPAMAVTHPEQIEIVD
jgi:micrococcal nuclease